MADRTPDLPLWCPECRVPIVAKAPAWACPVCGSTYPDHEGWIDFVPDIQDVGGGIGPKAMQWKPFARVYEGLWRPFYMSAARGHRFDFPAEIQWIVDQLDSARGELVLDLSCGPGVVGRELARSEAFSTVFGLDFSPAMLRQCRRNMAREDLRHFPLVRGDAGRLPIADGSLAGVHAGAALHVWPSVPQALREVVRALRPGGTFVASTFIHAKGWRGRSSRAFASTMDITFFLPGELAAAAEAAGFTEASETIAGSAVLLTARAPG